MSAPVRVPGARIREAIENAGGNVTQASRDVGLAANSLRKRLEGVGVDPGELARLRGQQRSVRVSGELFAKLREAKFDLQQRLRRELTEGEVLEMFAETFEGWLAGRLGRPL